MLANISIAGLPGEDLVREGLDDFESGRCTMAACLVAMATQRLGQAGLIRHTAAHLILEPELQLYPLLNQPGSDAYSRYNALGPGICQLRFCAGPPMSPIARLISKKKAFRSKSDRRLGFRWVCFLEERALRRRG